MGCIMGKCRHCRVEILDVAEYCPLCRTVLSPSDGEMESMYPDALVGVRKSDLISRIYLFCGIVVELLLVSLNALQCTELWWSAITGLGILYGYLVLRYAVVGRSGYRSKTVVLVLMGVLTLIAVDFVIGYRGWSLDYSLPAGILLLDAAIVVLMICNRRCWQSYIVGLLEVLLFSVTPVVLYASGLEKNVCMAFLPLTVTALIVLGTLMIGGRRATEEIKRRFHIN